MYPKGQGALSYFFVTRDAILPQIYGNSVQLIGLEAVASPLASRAVSVLLPDPLVATLPDARGREDGAGPADPVGVFMSGAGVGGNIYPTREGSFALVLLEKGNEVANLDDSS